MQAHKARVMKLRAVKTSYAEQTRMSDIDIQELIVNSILPK